VTYWSDEFQRVQSPILRYGFAAVSVTIATAVSLALQKYQFRDVELPILVLAVGLTTWFAGSGPSVLAVLLSTAVFSYLFAEFIYSFAVSARDLPYFLCFVISAIVIASFSAVRRRIEDNLRHARDRLQIEREQRQQREAEIHKLNQELTRRAAELLAANKEHHLPIPYRMTCGHRCAISSATRNFCKNRHRVRWTTRVGDTCRRFSNQEKEWAT
jgi:K+-sensing histidine kinase KdpD